MLKTSAGRALLRHGVVYRLWPVLSRAARLYRRTLVHRVRVVAVVGSSGKSTTTRAVSVALGLPPPRSVLANCWSLLALTLLRVRPNQCHAVIEVGIADCGQMELYARVVRPEVTVVTSIGSDHIAQLKSLQVTRSEKAKMVTALPVSGTAVLNGDDANVMWMREQSRARIVTFGFGAGCDVRADEVRLDWPHGTRFRLTAFGQIRETSVRLIGHAMLRSALAAVAVSQVEGVDLDKALSRLATLPPTRGRMDPIALPNGAWVLRDDYKSSVETIHAALDVLAGIPARRRIVLLGNLSGPVLPDTEEHEALAGRAAQVADCLVVVSTSLRAYRAGAIDAGMPSQAIVDGGRTPREAAHALAQIIQPGDVVLIKGHRNQRLDRTRMILHGHRVECDIGFCDMRAIDCEDCAMLETGWAKHRVIM